MSLLATAPNLTRRPAAPPQRSPRPFEVIVGGPTGYARLVSLCVGLLTLGLIVVLLLNTAMASGAFTLQSLQGRSHELTDQQEVLQASVEHSRSPSELAAKALALGMVPAGSAAFVRLSDGAILGVPQPASTARPFSVVTPATSALATTGSAPAASAPPVTTVVTEGTITRTTVVTHTATGVETTVTSVDSATGATTRTTTRTP